MPTGIVELARRWARAAERGKGIRLETRDVELMIEIGAAKLLMTAAADELAASVAERRAAGPASSSSAAPPSAPEDVARAATRARRALRR